MVIPPIPKRYIIFSVLAVIYILIYFQRTSTSAISGDLMRDLHLNASQLGTISSSYFFSYALMLPLVGYLTDRLGSKAVIVGSFAFTSIASILFSYVNDINTAIIVRSLIGVGSAGIFIPALTLLAGWFEPSQSGKVNGLFVGLGSIGSLLATFPLAYLDYLVGWRNFFILFSVIGVMFSIVAVLFLKNKESNGLFNKPQPKSKEYLETIRGIVCSHNFTILQAIIFISTGINLAFLGLWSTKYVMEIVGTSSQVANSIIVFLPLGCLLGGPLGGYLSDNIFHNRKFPLCIALVMQAVFWFLITMFANYLLISVLSVLMFLLGLFSGMITPLVFCILKDSVPKENYGLALGLLNPSIFIGIFIIQVATSSLLDFYSLNGHYTSHSFFIMMFFCAVLLMISALVGFFIKEDIPFAYNKSNFNLNMSLAYAFKPVYRSFHPFKNIINIYHFDFNKINSYKFPSKTQYIIKK